jgi:hypothetical protein
VTDSTIERAPDPAADGPAASAEAAGVPAGEPPDHIPLRGVVAALLGIMGVGAVVLGGHDTFAGGDVPVRLVGTIVLVAGIFFVVAAAALLADWREDRLLASMACVWGFLLAILILLSQLTNGEPSGTLAIWVAVMVLCATSFLMVRRSASATDRQRFIKALPAAGSVVSVGVLISLAQFYYTTIYLPASAPPSLNVTIKLEPAGRQGDRMVLHGEVTVTNISNTRATVLTSDVSVLGMNGDATPFKYFTESLPGVPQGSPLAAQRYWGLSDYPKLLYLDRVFRDRETFLDPDYSRTEPITLVVPAHRFDYLYVQANIFMVRGTVALDWARSTERRNKHLAKGTVVDVSTMTPITERGWLRDLIRANRSITTRWTLDATGVGGVSVRFAPDDERLSKSYGYAKTSASFQLPLWKSAN